MKQKLLNKILKLTLGTALAVSLGTNTHAGTFTWDFDGWLTPDGPEELLTYAGDANSVLLGDYKGLSEGNPATGGFLQLTPPVAGRNIAIVFPDIDDGAPVKAFKITMDVRAGNGILERPADGFSISYVRESDVVLSNATVYVNELTGFGISYGYGGGDSDAQTLDPIGSGNAENGTKTGVAISFDTWQGNRLPDTGAGGIPGPDVEGLAVRVDDKTLVQVAMPVRNANCANDQSLQTGAWLNDGGSFLGLEWCKLEVEKTADNKINVTWKGRKVLENYQIANYSPHKGRLILAGRTGDNNQNVHFDNISLETTPAIEPLVKSLAVNVSDLKGWTLTLEDYPPSAVTTVTQVKWNGVDVTSSITTSRNGLETAVVYTQANRLPANSANAVEATFETSLGQTITVFANATTPDYFVMPPAYALPLSAVSGQPRGIALGQAWQTIAENRNSQGDNKLNWTEEQILGLRGANLATVPSPAATDVIDFQNGDPAGNFRVGGSLLDPPLRDGADYSLQTTFGIGQNAAKANTDDGAIEWFSYVNFPTAGDYTMVVNSDDGFRLTTARNAKDRMGDVISFFNAGRGAGTGVGAGTLQRVIVDQPGVYPIRGLLFNRGGGFNVEWYTRDGENLYLVNSNSTPQALQAWQSATTTGSYVHSAIPVRSAVDVGGDQKIIVELANGTATVNAGSIVLKVDGATVSPTITSGATTKVELNPVGPNNLWPSSSSHNVELTFTDSASTAYSYAWSFSVAPYTVLVGGYPIGSEDPTKAGFTYSTYQLDPAGTVGFPNRIYAADQIVQGWWGPNTATLASGPVSGVINFDIAQGAQGNFTVNNGYQEALIPGIPGTSATPTDWFASEILTYVEFPTAGFYSLGFNSDDGFWTRQGHARPTKLGQLTINSPASIAGNKGALLPAANAGLEVLATNDVTGELVMADPIQADVALVNAAQVAGKIAVVYRGVGAFALKIQNCAAAGAIGVIIVQNRPDANLADGVFPIEPGATTGPIPSVMVHLATGNAITNALASGSVTGTLNAVINLADSLGYADVGRGATDTIYNMVVTTPGIYPLRTMWWQGNGGGNCEWFSIKNGIRTLLNDSTNPAALKTWYGLSITPAPELSFARDGANLVLTYTGTLQSADVVTGPYTDVIGATSPYSTPTTGAPKYFRTRD
jgi:hypothetical protein